MGSALSSVGLDRRPTQTGRGATGARRSRDPCFRFLAPDHGSAAESKERGSEKKKKREDAGEGGHSRSAAPVAPRERTHEEGGQPRLIFLRSCYSAKERCDTTQGRRKLRSVGHGGLQVLALRSKIRCNVAMK